MRVDHRWRPTTEHFSENDHVFQDEIAEVEGKGEMTEIFHRELRREVHEEQ
jgi:hypothetical protein